MVIQRGRSGTCHSHGFTDATLRAAERVRRLLLRPACMHAREEEGQTRCGTCLILLMHACCGSKLRCNLKPVLCRNLENMKIQHKQKRVAVCCSEQRHTSCIRLSTSSCGTADMVAADMPLSSVCVRTSSSSNLDSKSSITRCICGRVRVSRTCVYEKEGEI